MELPAERAEADLTMPDDRKDYREPRFIIAGYIENRMMVAVYTQNSLRTIRIISLRKANSREKARFEETIKNRLGADRRHEGRGYRLFRYSGIER